ncbi:hypothetical protein K439DRAFT_1619696 [Ramaria rubella]|nr:hypothetical protein K439DRAFT_1619696 [Ramaria rubella]
MTDIRKAFQRSYPILKHGSTQVRATNAFVDMEKHYSNKSIDLLSRRLSLVALKDMIVHEIHRDSYFLCRVMAPPTRLAAIEAVVEDPEGGTLLLSLYNFPSMMDAGPEDIDAIFPVGTILASGNCFIRVDSPSDVYFAEPGSIILRGITWRSDSVILGAPKFPVTVSGWEELGNQHFKASRWLAAAVAYTKGLILDSSAIKLQVSRAEAYLRLHYFSAALLDAEKVLESSDISKEVYRKALFRAGMATYLQENFKKAICYFQKVLQCSSNDSEANAWLHRARLRDEEKHTGRYDWLQIFLNSQKTQFALDLADYVGSVEVVKLPSRGGGRGIVATQDIKAGELLMVAKPFAAVFKEDLLSSETKLNHRTVFSKGMDNRCEFAVLHQLVNKIHGNPELHDLIYHLCPQPPCPPIPSSYPPSISNSQILPHPLNSNQDIDISLLENICSNNRFMPTPLCHAGEKRSTSRDAPSALYLLPSLFNHSCLETASRVFFREVMVIRAAINMKKGEEITIAYSSGFTAYTRQKSFDIWNIRCTCEMCENDRASGEAVCKRREGVMLAVNALSTKSAQAECHSTDRSSEQIQSLEILVKQVADTYNNNTAHGLNSVLPALAVANNYLARALHARARKDISVGPRAVVEAIKSLEATGISVVDKSTDGQFIYSLLPINTNRGPGAFFGESCVLLALMIVELFLWMGDNPRADMWLRTAWWLEDVTVGGGKALFEERYKEVLQATGINCWSESATVQF